jgi:hypothetical protein
MSEIEITSGLETVLTSLIHYGFRWMGGHWKQEIVGVGGSQAIPKIWSTEGVITRDGHLMPASPAYQRIEIKQASPEVAVAHLEGRSAPLRHSAVFTFEERPEEVVVDVEVKVQGSGPDEIPHATYLIESSDGNLEQDDAVTISWPNPDTKLVFEAGPGSRVEAHEAGMGTIRLQALAPHDSSAEVQTLRYRWRWISKPGHQIWDREV